MLAKLKGQIPFIGLVIGGLVTIATSIGTATITASSQTKEDVAVVRQEVAIVKTIEDLHYKELERRLEEQDKKLDAILSAFNLTVK